MSNRHRPLPPIGPVPADRRPGTGQRVRLFLAWFFAPRAAPRAWQRKPYLRDRGRRPGRFTR